MYHCYSQFIDEEGEVQKGKEHFPKVTEVGSQGLNLNPGPPAESTSLITLSYHPRDTHVLLTLLDDHAITFLFPG